MQKTTHDRFTRMIVIPLTSLTLIFTLLTTIKTIAETGTVRSKQSTRKVSTETIGETYNPKEVSKALKDLIENPMQDLEKIINNSTNQENLFFEFGLHYNAPKEITEGNSAYLPDKIVIQPVQTENGYFVRNEYGGLTGLSETRAFTVYGAVERKTLLLPRVDVPEGASDFYRADFAFRSGLQLNGKDVWVEKPVSVFEVTPDTWYAGKTGEFAYGEGMRGTLEVKFYPGDATEHSRLWLLKPNNGMYYLKDEFLEKGSDPLFKMNDNIVLPIGRLKVKPLADNIKSVYVEGKKDTLEEDGSLTVEIMQLLEGMSSPRIEYILFDDAEEIDPFHDSGDDPPFGNPDVDHGAQPDWNITYRYIDLDGNVIGETEKKFSAFASSSVYQSELTPLPEGYRFIDNGKYWSARDENDVYDRMVYKEKDQSGESSTPTSTPSTTIQPSPTTETENTEQTVTLRVTDEKGNFVSGTVFEIVDETTGKPIRTITTSDKAYIINDLPFHTHMTFKQISTAEGKTIAEPISGIYLTPDKENHFKGIGIDVMNYSVDNIGVTYKDEVENTILEGSITGAVGTTLKEENLPTAPKWYYFTDTYTTHPIVENEPDIVRNVKKKILCLTLTNEEGKSLPGSKFEIKQNNQIIAKITVSDTITDLTTIPELNINETYTIVQSEAIPGYIRAKDPIEFTINDDTNTQNLVFVNYKGNSWLPDLPVFGPSTPTPTPTVGPIETPTSTPISKVTASPIVLANPTNEKPIFTVNVQDDNDNPVTGAVFVITDTKTNETVTSLTTENGIAEYNGLEYEKSYSIKQVSAPEGYETVSYEREIYIDKETDSQSFYYINPSYTPGNDDPVFIAKLTVIYSDENNNTVITHTLLGEPGDTIAETPIPPKGYYFTDTFSGYTFTQSNEQITRKITKKEIPFIVTDNEGSNVKGSVFDITDDETSEKIITITTTENPLDLMDDLQAGKTYTITQVSAPDGYEMTTSPISITVTDNADKQEVKVTNAKEVLPTTEDIGVKYVDENGVTVLSESITKTEGETLKESDLPESPKWYYFTDTFTEHVVVRKEPDITRSVAKKALPFIVTDGEGNNVEGSTFDIMEGDKKVAAFTTANKPYDLTEIPAIDPNKTYTIKQVSAPKGYEMTTSPISITVTDNADIQEVKVTNAKEVLPTTEDIAVKYVDEKGVTVLSESITKTEGETLKESDLPESPKWYYFTDTFTEHVVVKEEPDITRSVAKKALPFIVTDEEGNNVEGSTFDIMEGDKKIASFTTTSTPLDLTEIPEISPNKTYTIKQVSAPKGYEMTTSPISITVTDNADKQEVKVTNAKEVLPTIEDIGVKYVDENETTVLSESITKTEGETLKESDLPESPKWYYFTDTFAEHVVVKKEPDITRSIAKKALPFIVTDEEGNNVEGSTFDIMEGDKKVATFTTTNKPYDLTEIPEISPNKTYTITQVSAPKGYEMTTSPISITVTDNADKQEVKVTNAKQSEESTIEPSSLGNTSDVAPSSEAKLSENKVFNTPIPSTDTDLDSNVSVKSNTPVTLRSNNQTTPNTGISEVGLLVVAFITAMGGAACIGMFKREVSNDE